MSADERQLAADFLGGSEAAFRALYRLHTPSLLAFTQRLLGPLREDAPDAVQETWLRAARDLRRFRWESKFRTWLFGIAANRCREVHRLAGREPIDAEEIEPAVPPRNVADRIDLERAIEGLSLRYREVLILHDIYQYTHEEIGSMLGIDTGTSKSNLSRARAIARRLLGEPDEH